MTGFAFFSFLPVWWLLAAARIADLFHPPCVTRLLLATCPAFARVVYQVRYRASHEPWC